MDEFIFIIFIQLLSYHRFFQYRNIERIVYPVVPPKVEYKLTNIGKTLDKVVYAICDWGGMNFWKKFLNRKMLKFKYIGKRRLNFERVIQSKASLSICYCGFKITLIVLSFF